MLYVHIADGIDLELRYQIR